MHQVIFPSKFVRARMRERERGREKEREEGVSVRVRPIECAHQLLQHTSPPPCAICSENPAAPHFSPVSAPRALSSQYPANHDPCKAIRKEPGQRIILADHSVGAKQRRALTDRLFNITVVETLHQSHLNLPPALTDSTRYTRSAEPTGRLIRLHHEFPFLRMAITRIVGAESFGDRGGFRFEILLFF